MGGVETKERTRIEWVEHAQIQGMLWGYRPDAQRPAAFKLPTIDGGTVEHSFIEESNDRRARCSCGYVSSVTVGPNQNVRHEWWLDKHARTLGRRHWERVEGIKRRPRDSQRAKVYAAEEEAFCAYLEKYVTLETAQLLLDQMSSHPVVARYLEGCTVELRQAKRGAKRSWVRYTLTSRPEILINRMATRATIIHEMAHIVANRMMAKQCLHGPEFVAVLVALTYRWGRPEYAEALAVSTRKVKRHKSIMTMLHRELRTN